MRIVVDTSVVFAGLYSRRGASNEILRGCLSERWTPIVSVPLAVEYEDVLRREELLKGSGLTRRDLDDFLDGFLAACDLVEIYYLWRPNLRDEDDNHVLEAAVSGNAAVIVTHNVKDFTRGDLRFDRIRIATPGEFLRNRSTSP